jgi:hypothetical protein
VRFLKTGQEKKKTRSRGPDFRVSGVPPEADQVSGQKNKTTET